MRNFIRCALGAIVGALVAIAVVMLVVNFNARRNAEAKDNAAKQANSRVLGQTETTPLVRPTTSMIPPGSGPPASVAPSTTAIPTTTVPAAPAPADASVPPMAATADTAPATVPPTEAPPETTTAPVDTAPAAFVPSIPGNDSIPYNVLFNGLDAPGFKKGPFAISNADMTACTKGENDFGHVALDQGPALFLSTGFVPGVNELNQPHCTQDIAATRLPANNLGLPGSGGTVVIGGHRTTGGDWAPFQYIDNLHPSDNDCSQHPDGGNCATVKTPWGNFIYHVLPNSSTELQGCLNITGESTDYCRTSNDDNGFWGTIQGYQHDTETLFLFSCENKGQYRVIVRLGLVMVTPPDPVA